MARPPESTAPSRPSRPLVLRGILGAAVLFAVFSPNATQNAVANGDTRTLTLYHAHTKERTTVTYRVNGRYDSAALKKLNWATRDWRRDEPINMDPRLFDVVWEAWRSSGSTGPITIMSAYRSPATNSMLRRRSRGVAKQSQHMLGKAMDIHLGDVSMAKVREIGMRMQRGGVGYYPRANSPFVHLDVGSVRSWPRMSYDQLARLFPDGKTVHLPSNGRPLPGYHAALAEIESGGGRAFASEYVTSGQTKGLFAFLFGSKEDEEDGEISYGNDVSADASPAATPRRSAPEPVRTAMRNLPRGETVMRPAAPTPAATPAPAPQGKIEIAALEMPLPPRKPAELIAAAIAEEAKAGESTTPPAALPQLAAVPLPPARPPELLLAAAGKAAGKGGKVQTAAIDASRLDPIAAKIAALPPLKPSLPDIITQGSGRSVEANAAGLGLMAYAPTPPARPELRPQARSIREAHARPAPMRQPARIALRGSERSRDFLVAARIDRSNFHALTSAAPTDSVAAQAGLLGSNVAPLRKAARNDVVALALRDTSAVVSKFGNAPAGDLSAGKFSGGAAARPISAIDSFGQLPRR